MFFSPSDSARNSWTERWVAYGVLSKTALIAIGLPPARQRAGSHRGNFHHLVMGLYILSKSTQIAVKARKPAGWMALLGFAGGFLDASGGGGGDQ